MSEVAIYEEGYWQPLQARVYTFFYWYGPIPSPPDLRKEKEGNVG